MIPLGRMEQLPLEIFRPLDITLFGHRQRANRRDQDPAALLLKLPRLLIQDAHHPCSGSLIELRSLHSGEICDVPLYIMLLRY